MEGVIACAIETKSGSLDCAQGQLTHSTRPGEAGLAPFANTLRAGRVSPFAKDLRTRGSALCCEKPCSDEMLGGASFGSAQLPAPKPPPSALGDLGNLNVKPEGLTRHKRRSPRASLGPKRGDSGSALRSEKPLG
jgi:hypothetical protein